MKEIQISTPIMGIVLVLLVILAGLLAYRASHSEESKFSLDDAFLDVNGKTSMGRIGQFSALCITTWGFAYLVVGGKMTEWYFGLYAAAWITNSIGNKWLDKEK